MPQLCQAQVNCPRGLHSCTFPPNFVCPHLFPTRQSTHGKDVKRVGFFNPEEIFGSSRTVLPKKVERQQERRDKRDTLRPNKRRALHVDFEEF